ncbi:MAG: hypothetical protein KGH89_00090 [Thaumarchaeota archaeon]|nr:hypothetical protein [Nitrososphaerota archaeon]
MRNTLTGSIGASRVRCSHCHIIVCLC